MKNYKISGKNRKIIVEVFSYLDIPIKEDMWEIIKSLTNKVPYNQEIGYAGCKNKKWLKYTLERFIPGKQNSKGKFKIGEEDCFKVIEISKNTIRVCKGFINKKIYIFIFPTLDDFVLEKMNGVNGFCSWEQVILIFLNPVSGWETSLKETICHELAHAVSPYYKGGNYTLGQGIILEGIAEHFRENVVGGKRAPWSNAIIKEQAIKIFKELKQNLESKDWKLYQEVFFGKGKYPLWTGYSIGYYIVEDYLKKQKNINWKELLKMSPKKILEQISFSE